MDVAPDKPAMKKTINSYLAKMLSARNTIRFRTGHLDDWTLGAGAAVLRSGESESAGTYPPHGHVETQATLLYGRHESPPSPDGQLHRDSRPTTNYLSRPYDQQPVSHRGQWHGCMSRDHNVDGLAGTHKTHAGHPVTRRSG